MSKEERNLTPEQQEISENNEIQNEQQKEDVQDEFQFLGDPTKKETKKSQKNNTIKKFIPIISLGVVLVLIFVAYVFLPVLTSIGKDTVTASGWRSGVYKFFGIKTSAPANVEAEVKPSIKIHNFTGTSADRLEIENSTGKFAFVKKVEKKYYIEGHEKSEVASASVLAMLTYMGSLEAVTEVNKNPEDLKQYGLETPAAKVTWIKGNTKHVLLIGNASPSGNYYAKRADDSVIYTISPDVATIFLRPRMDFYSSDIYDFNQQTDANYINYIEIGQKGKEPIIIKLQDLTDETIDSAYIIESPIKHNMSMMKSNDIIDLISNMTTCTVFDDDVSQQSLEKYGLADPAIKFTFVNVAEKHSFRFSEADVDGYVYMYEEDGGFVYKLEKSIIEVLTFNLADYCESMAYPRSYDTFDKITITGGGKQYKIEITGSADGDDLKAFINDKYVEFENFSELYGHIIGIEVKDIQDNLKTDDLIVTIVVDCSDGTVDTLRYYKQSDLNSYFQLNGEGRIVVSTAKVEQILEFAQKLYDGEEIVTEW